MVNKAITNEFNNQINEEIFSAYLYLSMAAYFDDGNLPGFGNWFKQQAREEMFHAMKFYNHLVERGAAVELYALKEPKKTWDSPLQAFADALQHEEHISGCINELMDLAMNEKDYAARNLLSWFVDEQVEEQASVTEVLEKLKLIGDQSHMLLMLDNELATRAPGNDPFGPPVEEG